MAARKALYLVPADSADVVAAMAWITDEESAIAWGGPSLRYPFTQESLLEDIAWPSLGGYALKSERLRLVGFGQVYLRESRGHLARLVVSPAQSGSR